ncbi:MAG: acetyl-CoA carboxylase biotin carboxyl carrier protein subunit [Rhodospirillales bacterium 70-18]|nr:acetyl-CoA carboxylase biotin carboxyl carrier protein [Rhodospirillales bacterium]OJY65810.1 MAG: acetyl-CoA carboxylase biotin carboxyl carrier protein subunit [Rhodospirillales bacterium 70-18]
MTSVPFDPEAVRKLATILVDTGLTEIEIEGKEGRIRVVRAHAPAATHVTSQAAAPAAIPADVAAPLAAPAAALDDAHHPGAVLSPMVGVAYLASEPGAPPFVIPGQAVTAGQTLLLIEAMKTYNQIKAPRAGTVTRILVAPSDPVEYGQPLLILE